MNVRRDSAEAAEAGTAPHRFHCGINCGSSCLLAVERADDGTVRVHPDWPDGAPSPGQGPCRIGLGMTRWQGGPERLLHPLRRVGSRGSGRFERVSWDDALDLLADCLRSTIDTYGNEAIYLAYGTGVHSVTGNAHKRLLNMLGGYLRRIYDYSTHMVQAAMPYMFGDDFSPYVRGFSSTYTEARDHSDLLVLFGDNPVETRRGPNGQGADFNEARKAVHARGGQVIHIDCRRNGSVGRDDEWIPIVPGTDAALVAGLVYELLATDKADLAFLHRYCVGFDEQTMPPSLRGKHASYRSYIAGAHDGVPKTPEWASTVTGVPVARIRRLATQLAAAKAPFISQGWGIQRHDNGEPATRAISVLPFVLGKVGLPGTNTGQRPTESPDELVAELPQGENPCKVGIPAYEWLNAVAFGPCLTAQNAGVQGADRLPHGIKFLWSYAGNCLTNQHGDVNWAHEVLADESKCPFIVVQDTVMTDSAQYADLVLPDKLSCEELRLRANGFSAFAGEVLLCSPAFEAPGECRGLYEVAAGVAERFGLREEFTQGRSADQWTAYLYEQARRVHPQLPSWNDLLRTGSYRATLAPEVGLRDFISDPERHPLRTPSGKVEIFSERLARLNDDWQLADGQRIAALPVYESETAGRSMPAIPSVDTRSAGVAGSTGWPGVAGSAAGIDAVPSAEVDQKFPLHCIGWHDRMRVHSSFGFADDGGRGAAPAHHRLWMNPADAGLRGIETGDTVEVVSAVGRVRMPVRVTEGIVAGTVGMPQGAWYRPMLGDDPSDEPGDGAQGRIPSVKLSAAAGSVAAVESTAAPVDVGGCINTLTGYRPTPLAKGNGAANSARVEVRRVSG